MYFAILFSVLLFWMYPSLVSASPKSNKSSMHQCLGPDITPHYPLCEPGKSRKYSKILRGFNDYQRGTIDEFLSKKSYSHHYFIKDPNNEGIITVKKIDKSEYGNATFESKCGAIYSFWCCCHQLYIGLMEVGSESPANTYLLNATKMLHHESHEGSCGDNRQHFIKQGDHPVPGSLRKIFLAEKEIVKDCKFLIRMYYQNDLMTLADECTVHDFDQAALDVLENFFKAEFNLPSSQIKCNKRSVLSKKIQDPTDNSSFNWANYLLNLKIDTSPASKYTRTKTRSEEQREKEVSAQKLLRQNTSELYAMRTNFVEQDYNIIVYKYNKMLINGSRPTVVDTKKSKSKEPSKILILLKYAFSSLGKSTTEKHIQKWIEDKYPHLNMILLKIIINGYLMKGIEKGTITSTGVRNPTQGTLTLLSHVDTKSKLVLTNSDLGLMPQALATSGNTPVVPSKKFRIPSTEDLVNEALESEELHEGCSLADIEKYVTDNYPTLILDNLKPTISKWLETEEEKGGVTVTKEGESLTYKSNTFQD